MAVVFYATTNRNKVRETATNYNNKQLIFRTLRGYNVNVFWNDTNWNKKIVRVTSAVTVTNWGILGYGLGKFGEFWGLADY
ncbi:MAG: hypothetical protein J5651_00480 [Salinivirgaceae bacterium]|nr:hypothetical protein [Salinivirgaceae bacterium]